MDTNDRRQCIITKLATTSTGNMGRFQERTQMC